MKPKTVPNTFIYQSGELVFDLANIDEPTWQKIQNDCRLIMLQKQTDNVGVAYIAAFLLFLYELDLLSEPFDSNKHKFH